MTDPSGAPFDARDDSAAVPGVDPRVNTVCLEVIRVDLAKLERLAAAMVRSLPPGLTFALVGTLGAGKTRMTQAIAGAFGIDRAEVTSPTFTLVQTHDVPHGRSHEIVGGGSNGVDAASARVHRVHHLDAYRLCDEDEFLDLGVEELFADAAAWTVVEWADRVADAMPSETVWVSIELEPVAESEVGRSGASAETEGGDQRRRIVFRTDDLVTRGALYDLARAVTRDPEADPSEADRSGTGVEGRGDLPSDGADTP